MKEERRFWFPQKTYGWGWGLPVRWQGWVVLVGYLALQYVGVRHFRQQHDGRGLLIYIVILTALLIAIVVAKGERSSD